MRDVILASHNPRAAERVRAILQSGQIFVQNVLSSGAEVLSYASIRPEAVVVCGRLSDMPATELARLLPNGFDVVWLLPSGEPQPGFCSNLVPLQMPVDRAELLDTVRTLAASAREQSRPRATRAPEEEALLHKAKEILMRKDGISEREAHRALQRRAMRTGQKLIEAARQVLSDSEE